MPTSRGRTSAWEVLVVKSTRASRRGHRGGLVTAGLAAGALLLTGCGSGQVAATTSQVAAVNGATVTVGQIKLGDVVMEYPETENATWPAGSDVPLSLTISNESDSDDELVSVSADIASSVEIGGTLTIPSRAAVVVLEGGEGSPQGAEPGALEQPGDALYAGTADIVLQGTDRSVTSGLTAQVTFTFRDAGAVTVPVPIAYAEGERTENSHDGLPAES